MKRFVGIGLALAVALGMLAGDALARGGNGDRQATQTQARDGSCGQVCDPACDGGGDGCQACDMTRDRNRDGTCDRQCDGIGDGLCDGDGSSWTDGYLGFGLLWKWLWGGSK